MSCCPICSRSSSIGRWERPNTWHPSSSCACARTGAAISLRSARSSISSRPERCRSAFLRACARCADACGATQSRRAPCGQKSRQRCRRSFCAVSSPCPTPAIRAPRISCSSCAIRISSCSPNVPNGCARATFAPRSRAACARQRPCERYSRARPGRRHVLPSSWWPSVCVPAWKQVRHALLDASASVLANMPGARLACVNVMPTSLIAVDENVDAAGDNIHVQRLVELRNWARPLQLPKGKVTYHLLESRDVADGVLDFARSNNVDHLIVGAPITGGSSAKVSARITAEAPCTVTVVRSSRESGHSSEIELASAEQSHRTPAE